MNVFSPYKGITVYDNVFGWDDAYEIEEMCQRAPFRIGWADTPANSNELFFHSSISKEWKEYNENRTADMDKRIRGPYSIIRILSKSKAFKDIDRNAIKKSVINCDTMADAHFKHVHIDEDVILYYVNREWKDGWGGDTIFYDNVAKNVVYTSPYTPNRMIKFDGGIVHTFRPPTRLANKFRFSLSTFIQKPHKTV
jgi:hypothetical protein